MTIHKKQRLYQWYGYKIATIPGLTHSYNKPIGLINKRFSRTIPQNWTGLLHPLLWFSTFLHTLHLKQSSLITQTLLWECPSLIMLECICDVQGDFLVHVRNADQSRSHSWPTSGWSCSGRKDAVPLWCVLSEGSEGLLILLCFW